MLQAKEKPVNSGSVSFGLGRDLCAVKASHSFQAEVEMALAAAQRWLLGILIWVLLAEGTALQAQREPRPEVLTKYGHLHGKLASVEGTDRQVKVFLGVPFAKPPIGSLRFSPPEPAEPWSHRRDATSYPPMCPQDLQWVDMAVKMLNMKLPNLTMSEDCLYLNVFTPDTKAKLPVMVWLHGGGLVNGAASMYDGSALAAYENVVVVVSQYRLGLAGFFSTGSKDARGNWGLLDQVAALQWVQENIEQFGGDPHSVTIFGESAGGFSVGAQILSPLSKGLFHRAISASGVAQLPGLIISHPENIAKKVADVSGCESLSSDLVHCLRSKTEEELNTLNAKLIQEIALFPAVVDGEFLPKTPEELLAAKEFAAVPYLIGTTNHEYGWIIPAVMNLSSTVENMDRQAITAAIQKMSVFLRLPPELEQTVLDEYLGDTEDPIKLRSGFQDMMGDALFVAPALQVARHHRDSAAPVYFYEFQHRPTASKATKPDFVKADHGDDVGFVFGGPFLRSDAAFLTESTVEERDLSRTIMKYWANFARTGNPNGQALVEWPPFQLNEEYLGLNLVQKRADKLKKNKVDFWLRALPEKLKKLREDKEVHLEL